MWSEKWLFFVLLLPRGSGCIIFLPRIFLTSSPRIIRICFCLNPYRLAGAAFEAGPSAIFWAMVMSIFCMLIRLL